MNDLNNDYRYAKFTMSNDGNITVECDMPISADDASVGRIAIEYSKHLGRIVNIAYPEIMKLIWG